MTELVRKQIIFSRYVSILISQFHDSHITMGEAWRSPETCALYAKEGKGISQSCHMLRLAIDLILWVDGKVSTDINDYRRLGEYWKELPQFFPDVIPIQTCWGGDFKNCACAGDIYHFSIEHLGAR